MACDLSLFLPTSALGPEEHKLGLLQDEEGAQTLNERGR